MTDFNTWATISVIALVTALLRFLPFVVFGNNRKIPPIINKLGRILPYAVMGMLVVYCFKNTTFSDMSGFLPQLISGLVVGVLYVWKRNTLVSIICGTLCYMVLIQMVF